jgi:hypothetical protein
MVTGVRRDRHLLSAWCLWQHRKVLKRNRTGARAVCLIGRSTGLSPGPDRPLAKPRFPPTGVSVVSAVFGGHDHSVSRSCRRTWRLNEATLCIPMLEKSPFSTCRESPPEICEVLILG